MPITVTVDLPRDNEVDLDGYFLETGNGQVTVRGKGNRLVIRRPLAVRQARFVVDGGASIVVDEGCVLTSLHAHALAPKASISIGKECGFNGLVEIMAHETAVIEIGRACLFGHLSSIMASDVHKIYDAATGERLNPAADIRLGDRVWMAPRSLVLRGSDIGTDSVVGFGSVVKGRFPPNVLIAGAPGRIARTGIRWER